MALPKGLMAGHLALASGIGVARRMHGYLQVFGPRQAGTAELIKNWVCISFSSFPN